MPLYNINKWFGWMSNDDYAWSNWAVYEAINVDISTSKWVKLSRSYELTDPSELFTSAQWKPMSMFYKYWTSAISLVISDLWIIKYWLWIWTTVDISAKVSSVSNMWIINDWNVNYWFILWKLSTTWYIYKWTLSDSADFGIWAAWVNIVDSWVSLPDDLNGSSSYFVEKSPYLVLNGTLYVVWWNDKWHNVFPIDITSSTRVELVDFLSLERGYEVTYMTNIWDQIIVYTSNWTHWKQYFWNGIGSSPDRVIDWYDRPILWWATLNNIDYVITWKWNRRELYQVQWYQANKIHQTDINVTNTEASKFYFTSSWWSNVIETIWDTLVLPASWYIYKYWNNTLWLPKNITRDKVIWTVNLITSNWENLIVCSQSSSFTWTFAYYRAITSLKSPDDSTAIYPTNTIWTIEWLKFDWDIYSIKKQSVKCKVWYDLPIAYDTTTTYWNWINIYARINNWYEYYNFYTYVYNNWSYTTKPSIGDVYTFWWKSFTVYAITYRANKLSDGTLSEVKDLWLILHTKCSDTRYNKILTSWELTKSSWDWDSSIRFNRADVWYELIETINSIDTEDLNTKEKTFMFSKDFHEIQFKFDLYTNNNEITPTLRDFYLQYNFIQNQI